MVHPYAILGFLAAVLPLVATPGASLALLIQHITDNGRRQARPVILGTVIGLYIHATLAIAGLSPVATHSSHACAAVKVIGAAHLIGLGIWVLSPKAASIHLTLVPQFIEADHSFDGQILALRIRGRAGGRRPRLTEDRAALPQRLCGEREKSVQQITDMCGVPRSDGVRVPRQDQDRPPPTEEDRGHEVLTATLRLVPELVSQPAHPTGHPWCSGRLPDVVEGFGGQEGRKPWRGRLW